MKKLVCIFSLTLLISACGFHLRGQVQFPFDTLFLAGVDESAFNTELRRNIEASSSAHLVDDPEKAQAILELTSVSTEKIILSLSGSGRVREFQLRYRVVFRVHDGKGREWLPSNEILLKRDFSFNDTQVLAKESEEALLYRDMQGDAIQQIIRRLSLIKPPLPAENDATQR